MILIFSQKYSGDPIIILDDGSRIRFAIDDYGGGFYGIKPGNRAMSHAFSRENIRIIVNSDWSGEATIISLTPDGEIRTSAIIAVRSLLQGHIDLCSRAPTVPDLTDREIGIAVSLTVEKYLIGR